MAQCKTAVTPLLKHWSYCSLALSHRYDDVVKWKHFPHYWPFLRGIHRSLVNSPHKGQWRKALMFFFYLHLNKRLSKQSRRWWFEMPSRSLWCHCNIPLWVLSPLRHIDIINHTDLNIAVLIQASKFQIECTCPSGKWIVKITCPNVSFTCLKYIKPMQLMWKSEICSRPSDKSYRYSTCPTVIFTRLRQSDEWNFEPWLSGVPDYFYRNKISSGGDLSHYSSASLY